MFEVLYEINRVVLPFSVIRKEVQKQVSHVVHSFFPNDRMERKGQLKRRLSSEVSFFENSPYNRSEVTSDASLLGTPSSLGAVLGNEVKRTRLVVPSYPADNSVLYIVGLTNNQVFK